MMLRHVSRAPGCLDIIFTTQQVTGHILSCDHIQKLGADIPAISYIAHGTCDTQTRTYPIPYACCCYSSPTFSLTTIVIPRHGQSIPYAPALRSLDHGQSVPLRLVSKFEHCCVASSSANVWWSLSRRPVLFCQHFTSTICRTSQ